MNKIDQILDSLYSRVIGPDEAKEELSPLINQSNVVSNDRTFSYEEVYKIASDVMNLGLSLRQDQLNGSTDKSGNEVLDNYMKKFKS